MVWVRSSAFLHGLLGIAYAGRGHRDDAVQEAMGGVQLRAVSSDAYLGQWFLMYLARTYILVGEYDKAIELLDTLVTIPSLYSRALLRVNRCSTHSATAHSSRRC